MTARISCSHHFDSSRRSFRPRLQHLEDRCTPSYVPITEFTAGITSSSSPEGIASGPDGNLWFADFVDRVGRISPTGSVTEFSTGITSASNPRGIVAGPDGNLWFTEFNGNRIGKITPSGTVTEFSSGITAGGAPWGITAGPDGNLWFTESNGDRIGRIMPTGTVNEFSAGITTGSHPSQIAAGPDGNLWFTEFNGNRIGRITPIGAVTEFSIGITGGSGPSGIAAGPDGNLWFTENTGNRIGRISTGGFVTEYPLQTGSAPDGITSGSDGNLWFAEHGRAIIGQITRAGVVTDFPLLGSGSHTPVYITSGPDGNLWFTDQGSPKAVGKGVLAKPVVTGADAGGRPLVRVFDGLLGNMTSQFLAYNPRFTGGVRVAMGDVNGDGDPDIVTAPGPGGGPEIRVFDGVSGALIMDFMAYSPAFTGGVYVACADVNGDGHADIITGPDAGGGPEVRVFSGKTQALIFDFLAFPGTFAGGVRVAGADVNHDGKADIIAGKGPGADAAVAVFSGANSALLSQWIAFPTFGGGVYVSAGDVNGDGFADVIVGAGAGGGPDVRVFNGANLAIMLSDFFAYSSTFTGGVRVAVADVDGDGFGDIITAPGVSGASDMRVFDVATLGRLDEFMAYDPSFLGGVFVGSR
jgi:streptogramin lyase